jgi:hypothetical protein
MNDQELREVFDYHGKERLVDGKNGAIGKNKDLPVHVKSFYPPGELARKAKLLGVRFFFSFFIFFISFISQTLYKQVEALSLSLSLSRIELNRNDVFAFFFVLFLSLSLTTESLNDSIVNEVYENVNENLYSLSLYLSVFQVS